MRTFGLLVALLLIPTFAAADDGPSVLAKMDESMSRAVDQYFEYEVVNEEKGRDPKVMELDVWIKGPMRLTEFQAPGDMKGTKALVRAHDQMYIYLPAYNKVRRVASSMTSGGFMGTTFSNDDISTVLYGPVYEGSLQSETDTAWVLVLTPKADAKTAYGKLVMTVSKKYIQPDTIEYFNRKDQHVKTETRSGYTCEGDVCNAESMKMVDHTRGDASTELVRRTWKVNTGVGDDEFSVRNLQN
ncbi:MAG: outer membrane lipoprotein-sorting protein [Proteobacteria bacterium]|nr:outer membrane lipoprotein-sorting protein [Pseudomonadota bacterium]